MAFDDELINRVTWKIPNALALVGSRSADERNAMTTSWITQLSMEPVLIGVGVDNSAVTHRLITDGGSFTVNLWSPENTRAFVKFSKPATFADGAWFAALSLQDQARVKAVGWDKPLQTSITITTASGLDADRERALPARHGNSTN